MLARIVSVPLRLLAPLILFLAVIGSYAIRNSIFDTYLMLGLGVLVFLVCRVGFHPGPIGLGIILGPIIEPALVQAMFLSDEKSVATIFFGSTVDIVLISATVLSVAFVARSRRSERVQDDAAEPVKPVEPAGA
jgi:putative tricarboxylic transport membrane protein